MNWAGTRNMWFFSLGLNLWNGDLDKEAFSSWVIQLENASSFNSLHLSHHCTYHLFTFIISTYCVPHKSLVYDLACHKSSIAQWLEHPTSILEGHGFKSLWGTRKIAFTVIQLENTSPFISNYYNLRLEMTYLKTPEMFVAVHDDWWSFRWKAILKQ